MTVYSVIFYVLAALILGTTAMAVTRRNLAHAVVYLIFSFFGTALLFYLFGAPLLAVLEVIIYAGAIMILFLFIIMMLKLEAIKERLFPPAQWLPAALCALVYIGIGAVFILSSADSQHPLKAALATPRAFGRFVFQHHWLSIEIISLLLLVALVGALYVGRVPQGQSGEKTVEDKP